MGYTSKKLDEYVVSIYEEDPPYREIKKVLVNYAESTKIPSREYLIMCDLVIHVLLIAALFISHNVLILNDKQNHTNQQFQEEHKRLNQIALLNKLQICHSWITNSARDQTRANVFYSTNVISFGVGAPNIILPWDGLLLRGAVLETSLNFCLTTPHVINSYQIEILVVGCVKLVVWVLSFRERHRAMEHGLYEENVHIHWNSSVLIKKLLIRIYRFCVRAVKYIATEARSLLSLARARAVEYATKARASAATTSATTTTATTTTSTTTSPITTTAAITTATTTTSATTTVVSSTATTSAATTTADATTTATTTAATTAAATTTTATTTTATTTTATTTTATTTTATTTTATATTATTTTDTKVATTDEAAANVDERDPNVALAKIVAANLAIANREDREAAEAYIAQDWDLVISMNCLETICFLSYFLLMYEVIMFIFWVLMTIEWL